MAETMLYWLAHILSLILIGLIIAHAFSQWFNISVSWDW